MIGYQLSDEDANKQNLITGTRYFNVEGMLPFENQVAEYIKKQKTQTLSVKPKLVIYKSWYLDYCRCCSILWAK